MASLKYWLLGITYVVILLMKSSFAHSQEYNRAVICGSDTEHVNYIGLKYGELVDYYAFRCKQVSPWGIRLEIGRSSFIYTPETARWLGRHNGGSFAVYVAYGNLNIGARTVLTSAISKTDLVLDGKLLESNAKLNPIKIEYSAGYSVNLKYNFCAEPFLAVTKNAFYVLKEDSIGKHYQIPQVYGFTTGIGLNKYFRVREFEFLALFVRYSHSFSNFKKVEKSLGIGYSEWNFGIAYKVFAKKTIMKPINANSGKL